MKERINKKYIFYRAYTLIVIALWNMDGFKGFSSGFTVYLGILLIPAGFMLFSLFWFPFNYSIFGKCMRTSLPKEAPIAKTIFSWGGSFPIGARMPFVNWYLYESGLGFSCFGIGKGFIPIDDITTMDFGFLHVMINHKNKEIRNPIVMPSSIGKKLKDLKERITP